MPGTGDPRWLVLLYAGGYNDLQPETAAAVLELCSAPLPVEVELAVLANLAPAWMVSLLRPGHRPSGYIRTPGTRRLITDPGSRLLVFDPQWHRPDDPLHQPDSLHGFLDWGLRLAPGARVALILSGHAAGILGVMADYSGVRPMLMTVPALASAIRHAQDIVGRRIDLLLLDTCYLNTVEVLYELAGPGTPCGRCLILPGDDAPLVGMPYGRIISVLRDLPCDTDLEKVAAGVADAINYCRGQPERGCFALRLAFEPLEQLRVEFERLAIAWLDQTPPGQLMAPPMDEMRKRLADALAGLALPRVMPARSCQPVIRCYVPASAGRFAPVAQAYARLGFIRGKAWRRMIGACVIPAVTVDGSGIPDPGVVALPRQLLVDHLRGTNPFLSESEVSMRLRQLGWEAPSGRLPSFPAPARRGLSP